jgi:hypothetical protein
MIQAKKEGVFDEPKFTEPPTLYEIIADWWCEDWTGSNTKICEDLLTKIEKWLPEEFLSYGEYGDGWNDCLKYIKENSND